MHVTLKNGKRYELPKLTVGMRESMAAIDSAKGIRERFEQMHELVSSIIPADELAIMVDGDTVEDVDVVTLASIYRRIEAAYMAPQAEEQMKAVQQQLARLQPALEALKTANKAAAMANK